ncbi:MAG: SGNH/GDSL hydrolase family protein [Pseudomonadota bacterium]
MIKKINYKYIVFSLIPTILFLILFEIACFSYFVKKLGFKNALKQQTPFYNFAKTTENEQDKLAREKYFKIQREDYFVFDLNLGVRFRPYSNVISLEPNNDGTPRIATDRKLKVNKYGFVSNYKSIESETNFDEIIKNDKIFKIIVSGGSTVAGWGASLNIYTWPAQLERLLNSQKPDLLKDYDKIILINTGVLGYNISQEIKLFIEETIYLNPDLLILFNGINEKYEYKGNPIEYSSSTHQRRMLHFLNNQDKKLEATVIFPYITKVLISLIFEKEKTKVKKYYGEYLYGYKNKDYIDLGAPDLYYSKILQFKGIAESHSVPFIYIFQPTMAFGKKNLTKWEEKVKKFFNSEFYNETWETYEARLNKFYEQVKPKLKEKCQFDFSNLFDNIEAEVYSDPRHYNDYGQKLIAQEIYKLILKNLYKRKKDNKIEICN